MTIYDEKDYPKLVAEVLKFIEETKLHHPELSLIDIIFDFSFQYDIAVECVGDAINDDIYFKSFIAKDCELHNNIKNETDW